VPRPKLGPLPPLKPAAVAVPEPKSEVDEHPVFPRPTLEATLPERRKAGALVGAFAAVVSTPEVGVADALAAVAHGWYVGINHVSVGPLRMSELHSKAAVGAVTPDSLVWRDGFENWQPLRTFPELLAVVDEARATSPHATVRASATVPASILPGPGDLSGLAPVVSPAPEKSALADAEAAGVPRPSRHPVAAWLAVAVALLFGLTIGFVAFSSKEPPRTVVKYVEREKVAAASSGEAPIAAAAGAGEKADPAAATRAAGRGTGAVARAADPAQADAGGLKGLAGLAGLAGLPKGPSGPGGGSEDSAGSSGQPLDSGQVQRTVSRYTGSVKRSCWQPALDTRDEKAPTTARVMVSIQVAPDGSVSSATSSGDPRGYRGLATCITSRVRAWKFPASSGTTTVNVPFVFAAQ
jgi:hypothetical protein